VHGGQRVLEFMVEALQEAVPLLNGLGPGVGRLLAATPG
jgi:hypothetical protein